jgi:hypothetical protein
MDETKNNTPAEEVVAEEVTEKAQTVGEILNDQPDVEKKPDSVPLSEFLEIKKSNKQLTKELKDLKKSIEDGATDREISTDIDALADQHNVDKGFLKTLVKAIKAETEKDLEDKISSKFKPIEEKEKQEKFEKAFNGHLVKVLEEMPEYKEIANPQVIKALSLLPENKNKTFAQILEETYGNATRGRRTIETSTPRGGKEPESLDFERMKSDEKYFDEVMKNPELKKEWSKKIIESVRL